MIANEHSLDQRMFEPKSDNGRDIFQPHVNPTRQFYAISITNDGSPKVLLQDHRRSILNPNGQS